MMKGRMITRPFCYATFSTSGNVQSRQFSAFITAMNFIGKRYCLITRGFITLINLKLGAAIHTNGARFFVF